MGSEHAPERSRLACLGVLGVDVYVSRQPLAQALPSRIITVASAPAPSRQAPPAPLLTSGAVPAAPQRPPRSAAAVLSEPATTSAAPVRPATSVSSTSTTAPPSAAPIPSAAAPTARELSRAVAFNLVTVTFPSGVMFVSDIRQVPLAPVLESGVLSFLRDVMFAVGRLDPALAVDVGAEYFQWPLVRKPGVDASERAARDVLAGLISRKLGEVEADTIVLMGRAANAFAGASGNGQFSRRGVRVLHCEPLGKLFAMPSKKAELWHILQPMMI